MIPSLLTELTLVKKKVGYEGRPRLQGDKDHEHDGGDGGHDHDDDEEHSKPAYLWYISEQIDYYQKEVRFQD